MSHHQRRQGDLAAISGSAPNAIVMRSFELTVADVDDGCREIEIEGELDLAVADRLQEAIDGCRSETILIDLAACQFIDSTGIAVIVNAHRDRQAPVVVHSPSDQVLRILDVTGLTAGGLVFADREQALAAIPGARSTTG